MTAAMEDWRWPPAYDPAYRPDPENRYWFAARETMDPAAREAAILARLRVVCAHAWENLPFYRRHWDAAGFHPEHLRSLEDFEARVPVIRKADLRAAQAAHPPFGDYLGVPEAEVFHIHGSSGTTGRPTALAISAADWQAIGNAHARVMWGMGVRPGDTICLAAIFSLYMGSWGALAGAERLGARAFPFGAGARGMTARCVQWLDMLRPAGFYGTPSYAIHLAETAIRDGVDPRRFGLRYLLLSGEPGASIPALRDRLADLYGTARIHDCGSMGEMTPWMHLAGTVESPGLLCWQDIVYTEICDPQTHLRVPYGQRGTPVYTHLERLSQPMIRLESGDLARWSDAPTACGRTYPHLPEGIVGRIDDMITVRGENVYPSEVEAALRRMDDYGGEHRIVVTREGAMDEILVSVEMAAACWARGPEARAGFRKRADRLLNRTLALRAVVEVVAEGTHPRTDFKARRVVDDRAAFAEMRARLAGTGQEDGS